MITLGEGSRLTGLGKTTLALAIKAGRLSATRTTIGSYEIDPAELARTHRPDARRPGEVPPSSTRPLVNADPGQTAAAGKATIRQAMSVSSSTA